MPTKLLVPKKKTRKSSAGLEIRVRRNFLLSRTSEVFILCILFQTQFTSRVHWRKHPAEFPLASKAARSSRVSRSSRGSASASRKSSLASVSVTQLSSSNSKTNIILRLLARGVQPCSSALEPSSREIIQPWRELAHFGKLVYLQVHIILHQSALHQTHLVSHRKC